jgi:hypothetical protein
LAAADRIGPTVNSGYGSAIWAAYRLKFPLGPIPILQPCPIPGGQSSYRHAHSGQDEFVYVLDGQVVLQTNGGEPL